MYWVGRGENECNIVLMWTSAAWRLVPRAIALWVDSVEVWGVRASRLRGTRDPEPGWPPVRDSRLFAARSGLPRGPDGGLGAVPPPCGIVDGPGQLAPSHGSLSTLGVLERAFVL